MSVSDSHLSEIRHLALDMDGTIYKGGTLFEFTKPFLESLDQTGIGYTFLTNNSSRSASDYLEKLQPMNLQVEASQIFTAGMATAEYLQAYHPEYRQLYVLGTKSLRTEFAEAGFNVLDKSAGDEPDAVIIAFDTELTYQPLCQAAYWIEQGKPYIATHPDLVCPTDEPTVLVDCGALTACLSKATGREPNLVLGKPHHIMLEGILRRHELQPQQLAMVGDRLSTDIEMAKTAGAKGVLVLTGEATLDDAKRYPNPPDLIVDDLAELGRQLAGSRK